MWWCDRVFVLVGGLISLRNVQGYYKIHYLFCWLSVDSADLLLTLMMVMNNGSDENLLTDLVTARVECLF